MTLTHVFFYFGYMVLFGGSVAALLWQHKRQRKTRLPFGEEQRLLRAPGETQLKKVRQFDEDGFMWMMLAAAGPATVGLGLLLITVQLPAGLQLAGAAVTLLAVGGTFYWAARWFAAKARESADRYLGYFGERLVAENLEPLKIHGWRVFHDVPGENNGHAFNIDHVVVGGGGVFAIETKTRRKSIRPPRPGFEPHKVFFDGRVLVWPTGEDSYGLEQAERSALWLATTLKAELGEKIFVQPILALPGWWVEMKPARETRLCRVVNPKGLPKLIPGGATVLDERQVAAIAAKLEARCRDVAY